MIYYYVKPNPNSLLNNYQAYVEIDNKVFRLRGQDWIYDHSWNQKIWKDYSEHINSMRIIKMDRLTWLIKGLPLFDETKISE